MLINGFARAFRDPDIIDLIGQHSGVAVTLFKWGSAVDERYMIPWHLLRDPASIAAFAATVETTARDPSRIFTGICSVIGFAVRLIAENEFEGRREKIDVSGDGHSNFGVALAGPQQAAGAVGIVINGLPILTRIVDYSEGEPIHTSTDYYGLEDYCRDHVIVGPGAFVEIADDYDDFARAFQRKLCRELSRIVSRDQSAPARQLAYP
ncbi:MAG: DUF1194 domain-containing protein [Alphaproteobacteria bacterium]